MLLIAPAEADRSRIWATALDPEPRSLPLLTRRGELPLSLVSFGCGLETLGLREGDQRIESEPVFPSNVENGLERWSTAVRPQLGASWSKVEALPPEAADILARIAAPEVPRCDRVFPKLELAAIDASSPIRNPTFAAQVAGRGVLVGTADGRHELVSPDGRATAVPQLRGSSFIAGFGTDSGELWLLDHRGTLSRGTLEGGFAPVEGRVPLVGTASIAWMDGSRGEAPFELFLATNERALYHYDGLTWRLLAARPPPPREVFIPKVLWLGPGEALSYGMWRDGEHEDSVLRVVGGVLQAPEVVARQQLVVAVGHHPQLGDLAATRNGQVFARQNGMWRTLVSDMVGRYINLLEPLGDGILIGAAVAALASTYTLAVYHPTLGACAPRPYTAGYVVLAAPLGEQNRLLFEASFVTVQVDVYVSRLRQVSGFRACDRPAAR